MNHRKILTLKQFMKRSEVIKLYKDTMKAINKIDNEVDREYMKSWARQEYKNNKSIPVTDEESINYFINHGKKSLAKLTVHQDLANVNYDEK